MVTFFVLFPVTSMKNRQHEWNSAQKTVAFIRRPDVGEAGIVFFRSVDKAVEGAEFRNGRFLTSLSIHKMRNQLLYNFAFTIFQVSISFCLPKTCLFMPRQVNKTRLIFPQYILAPPWHKPRSLEKIYAKSQVIVKMIKWSDHRAIWKARGGIKKPEGLFMTWRLYVTI